MTKTMALLRSPDASIVNCELTHMAREPISFEKIKSQHIEYARTLQELGMTVEYISELTGAADGVFVEDTALVFPEVAIICRPGADSRKQETDSVRQALRAYRKVIKEFSGAARIDGGDVLQVERTIYVGQSSRTNDAAFLQMKDFLGSFGYEVKKIPVTKCLHLKTGVCYLGDNTILLNPEWIDPEIFNAFRIIETDNMEPFAANAIRFKDTIIHAEGYPLTGKKILEAGFKVKNVLISELAKAEAGLTCLSLIFGV